MSINVVDYEKFIRFVTKNINKELYHSYDNIFRRNEISRVENLTSINNRIDVRHFLLSFETFQLSIHHFFNIIVFNQSLTQNVQKWMILNQLRQIRKLSYVERIVSSRFEIEFENSNSNRNMFIVFLNVLLVFFNFVDLLEYW